MDEETLAKVERVERELREIDAQIEALYAKRHEVERSDQEYAEYLERFEYLQGFTEREGVPLSIRAYYRAVVALDALNAKARAMIGEGNEYGHEAWLEFIEEHKADFERLEALVCA